MTDKDQRKNPREQKGQDSCMTVAVPVVVGIGMLAWKIARADR